MIRRCVWWATPNFKNSVTTLLRESQGSVSARSAKVDHLLKGSCEQKKRKKGGSWKIERMKYKYTCKREENEEREKERQKMRGRKIRNKLQKSKRREERNWEWKEERRKNREKENGTIGERKEEEDKKEKSKEGRNLSSQPMFYFVIRVDVQPSGPHPILSCPWEPQISPRISVAVSQRSHSPEYVFQFTRYFTLLPAAPESFWCLFYIFLYYQKLSRRLIWTNHFCVYQLSQFIKNRRLRVQVRPHNQ